MPIKTGLRGCIRKRQRTEGLNVAVGLHMNQIDERLARPPLRIWQRFLRGSERRNREPQENRENAPDVFHGNRCIVTVIVSFEPNSGASGNPGTASSTCFVS